MNETFYKTAYTFTLLNKHKIILSLNSCIWKKNKAKRNKKKTKNKRVFISIHRKAIRIQDNCTWRVVLITFHARSLENSRFKQHFKQHFTRHEFKEDACFNESTNSTSNF